MFFVLVEKLFVVFYIPEWRLPLALWLMMGRGCLLFPQLEKRNQLSGKLKAGSHFFDKPGQPNLVYIESRSLTQIL